MTRKRRRRRGRKEHRPEDCGAECDLHGTVMLEEKVRSEEEDVEEEKKKKERPEKRGSC